MRHGPGIASWILIGALGAPGAGAAAEEAAPADSCGAQSVEQCIAQCRQKFPGPEHRAERYACFDRAEAAAQAKAGAEAPPGAESTTGGEGAAKAALAAESARSNLMRLWSDEPKPISFEPYRQSYMLFTHTHHPNNAPTSPNPSDRVTPTYDLLQGEAKFQFSFKALIFRDATFGLAGKNNLWFAYTQQSHWQIFDAAHSRPFRESNYEPELILSHPLNHLDATVLGMRPAFANLAFVHQSNGQSDPRSRSWNRVTAQLGLYRDFSGDSSFAVLLRPWWRFREAPETDNNADITHYLGYGDIEALYWNGPYLVSVLARVRSVQLDVSRRLSSMKSENQARSLQLHLQLFTGYGESLIDYNQAHTTIGLGLSVPYGL